MSRAWVVDIVADTQESFLATIIPWWLVAPLTVRMERYARFHDDSQSCDGIVGSQRGSDDRSVTRISRLDRSIARVTLLLGVAPLDFLLGVVLQLGAATLTLLLGTALRLGTALLVAAALRVGAVLQLGVATLPLLLNTALLLGAV